jgi:hypothetical protein
MHVGFSTAGEVLDFHAVLSLNVLFGGAMPLPLRNGEFHPLAQAVIGKRKADSGTVLEMAFILDSLFLRQSAGIRLEINPVPFDAMQIRPIAK